MINVKTEKFTKAAALSTPAITKNFPLDFQYLTATTTKPINTIASTICFKPLPTALAPTLTEIQIAYFVVSDRSGDKKVAIADKDIQVVRRVISIPSVAASVRETFVP